MWRTLCLSVAALCQGIQAQNEIHIYISAPIYKITPGLEDEVKAILGSEAGPSVRVSETGPNLDGPVNDATPKEIMVVKGLPAEKNIHMSISLPPPEFDAASGGQENARPPVVNFIPQNPAADIQNLGTNSRLGEPVKNGGQESVKFPSPNSSNQPPASRGGRPSYTPSSPSNQAPSDNLSASKPSSQWTLASYGDLSVSPSSNDVIIYKLAPNQRLPRRGSPPVQETVVYRLASNGGWKPLPPSRNSVRRRVFL